MKKYLLTLFSLFVSVLNFTLLAQYKVSFVFKKLPSYHKHTDKIYLAGSFNNWSPRNEKFASQADGIKIELPKGMFEYKFTKGSWETVEAGDNGAQIPNRKLEINKDTTIEVEIKEWSDHFPKKPKETTAGSNVHIVDTAFFMPQLNRYRRVWIYLPASYKSSKKRYPVLYMHDGQNVFDAATSFSGEWGVDEALDTLGPKHELIVVAVDNGGSSRINEYSAYDMKYGKAEGDAYLDFIVNTLRPHVNKHYRTQKSGKQTFIAGSSMGGLISFYALLKYPSKFGGAGIFSPAFWINPQFKTTDPKQLRKIKSRVYFFAGQQEGEAMVPDMLQVFDQLQKHSKAEIQTVIRAEGTHSENTWRHEFPLFVQWLLESKK